MRLWVLMLLMAVLSISGCPEHAYPTCGYCAVQMFDAENKKDVRICDELENLNLLKNNDADLPVSTCKDICYEKIAVSTKNVSICDRLQEPGDYKSECYRMVGIASNNAALCDAIRNIDSVDAEPNWKRCYYDVALNTRNFSLCDKISGDDKSECYRVVGIASNDASICDAINDGPNQKRCYYDIAINTRNLSLCDKISGDDLANCYGWGLLQNVCKTNCYSELTKKLNKTE